MRAFEVRAFRPGDAEDLARLYRRSVEALGPRGYRPEQVAAWALLAPSAERLAAEAADGRLRLVAVLDGAPAGFADLEPDGHIAYFYCAPEAAGTGQAGALYAELERRARLGGVARLYAEASEVARGFFRRQGFRVLAERRFAVAGVAIHNYAVEKEIGMRFEWLNPPPAWTGDAAAMTMETAAGTDFWRETFYGFTRDSGHAWLTPVAGDFSAAVRFRGEYRALYDQAGLMLRTGADAWIKAGVEFTDGAMHFSVVATGPVSDWSVIPLDGAGPETEVSVRITRHGDAARVQYAVAGGAWRMARLAPFPAGAAEVGLMACSPEGPGFTVRFEALEVGPAIPRALHG